MGRGGSLDRINGKATLDLTKVTSIVTGQKSQLQNRPGGRLDSQLQHKASTNQTSNVKLAESTDQPDTLKQKELPRFLQEKAIKERV